MKCTKARNCDAYTPLWNETWRKERSSDDLNKNTILLSSFIERSLFKNSIPWLMARESRTISIRVVKLARVTTCRSTVCDLSRIRDDICTEMVERMVRNGGWCKNDLDKYYEPLIFSSFFFFRNKNLYS